MRNNQMTDYKTYIDNGIEKIHNGKFQDAIDDEPKEAFDPDFN